MSAPYPRVDDRAPCRRGDPERFFPHSAAAPEDVIDQCRSCPFVEPCLAYAMEHAVIGIWGATTARQRRALRRSAGIRAAAVQAGHVMPKKQQDPFERAERHRAYSRARYQQRKQTA